MLQFEKSVNASLLFVVYLPVYCGQVLLPFARTSLMIFYHRSDRKTDPQIAPQVGYLINTPSALQNSLTELLLFLWSVTQTHSLMRKHINPKYPQPRSHHPSPNTAYSRQPLHRRNRNRTGSSIIHPIPLPSQNNNCW